MAGTFCVSTSATASRMERRLIPQVYSLLAVTAESQPPVFVSTIDSEWIEKKLRKPLSILRERYGDRIYIQTEFPSLAKLRRISKCLPFVYPPNFVASAGFQEVKGREDYVVAVAPSTMLTASVDGVLQYGPVDCPGSRESQRQYHNAIIVDRARYFCSSIGEMRQKAAHHFASGRCRVGQWVVRLNAEKIIGPSHCSSFRAGPTFGETRSVRPIDVPMVRSLFEDPLWAQLSEYVPRSTAREVHKALIAAKALTSKQLSA